MLKVTTTFEDDNAVTLRLDGSLVSTTLSELERLCLHYRNTENKMVSLDFSGVAFIDERGAKLVRRITSDRVAILNCSLFVKTFIEELPEETADL